MPPPAAAEPTSTDWPAVADALARRLEPRAREIETARRLPQDVADALAAAGLYRLLTPRCYGGHELHLADFVAVVERLARSDAAVAWCTFIACTASVLAAYLPPQGAAPLFSRPTLKMAGVFAPRGRAVPATEDGVAGYRVSGRWAWGSGAHNADVISGGCLVVGDDDRPQCLADGTPRVLAACFDRAQVHLLDNWHSVGLCGTGSGEFEVDAVFVPAVRTASLFDAPVVDGTLYRFPVFGLLALSIAAVAAGLARRAIDEFVALAARTVPQGGQRTLAQRAAVQEAVAQAEAALRAARAFLHESIDAAWAGAAQREAMALDARRDLRLAATHLVHEAARVVDRMYTLAGGAAVFADSPLQRCLRDVHVATQHAMVGAPTWELAGRSLLGLPTNVTML